MPEGAVKLCADGRVTLNPNGTRALCCDNTGTPEPVDPGNPGDIGPCCRLADGRLASIAGIQGGIPASSSQFPVNFFPTGYPALADECVGRSGGDPTTATKFNIPQASVLATFKRTDFQSDGSSILLREQELSGSGPAGFASATETPRISGGRLKFFASAFPNNRVFDGPSDIQLNGLYSFLLLPRTFGGPRTHRTRLSGFWQTGIAGGDYNYSIVCASVNNAATNDQRFSPTTSPRPELDSGFYGTIQSEQTIDYQTSFFVSGGVWQISVEEVVRQYTRRIDFTYYVSRIDEYRVSANGQYRSVDPCPSGGGGIAIDAIISRIRG